MLFNNKLEISAKDRSFSWLFVSSAVSNVCVVDAVDYADDILESVCVWLLVTSDAIDDGNGAGVDART